MERVKAQKLRIGGMTCVSCQNKIERKLQNTAGIKSAVVSYSAGTAEVTYDADVISIKEITAVIEKLDYEVLTGDQPNSKTRVVGILIIAVAAFVLLEQFGFTQLFTAFPLAEAGMGYGMLFIIGLITSVHCVAMCGGINLSQCIPQAAPENTGKLAALRPSFLYNLGRVISYTVVGAIVGALGSVVSLTGAFKGVVQLLAGVFMVIMGLNMLGIFPWLRKLTPRMPKVFARGINKQKAGSNSPLYVGLLNGLMPCGPLQAMQLYALSTASPVKGAISMMLFSLGTVPLMFGLGALSSVLSKRFTRKVMTVGAALVVVLGLSMFTQGWSLSGFSLPELIPQGAQQSAQNPVQKAGQTTQAGSAGTTVENGVQIVTSTLASGKYPAITVQAGTPVKWTINAAERSINGCNNRIFIPEYNIEYQFQPGENVIEFTPGKAGKFPYSCWMGMIRGSITVVEAGTEIPASEPAAQGDISTEPSEPVPAGVSIPTGAVAVAKIEDNLQTVEIELTDEGLQPAVVVMQANVDTEWTIINNSTRAENAALLFPAYYTQFPMPEGETPLYLYPTESFDFSTQDNVFYGYVKVVEDIEDIDIEAIKEEAGSYKTMIWPPSYFEADSAAPGCCG